MPKTKAYNIREATKNDVIDLTILGRQFIKEANMPHLGWDNSKTHDFFLSAIDQDHFCVFVQEEGDEVVGMFVGLATPCFFSHTVQTVEIMWYVDPDHRGSRAAWRMVERFEGWSKEQGAASVSIVNLSILKADKVGKLYERKGYKMTENTFAKELV